MNLLPGTRLRRRHGRTAAALFSRAHPHSRRGRDQRSALRPELHSAGGPKTPTARVRSCSTYGHGSLLQARAAYDLACDARGDQYALEGSMFIAGAAIRGAHGLGISAGARPWPVLFPATTACTWCAFVVGAPCWDGVPAAPGGTRGAGRAPGARPGGDRVPERDLANVARIRANIAGLRVRRRRPAAPLQFRPISSGPRCCGPRTKPLRSARACWRAFRQRGRTEAWCGVIRPKAAGTSCPCPAERARRSRRLGRRAQAR